MKTITIQALFGVLLLPGLLGLPGCAAPRAVAAAQTGEAARTGMTGFINKAVTVPGRETRRYVAYVPYEYTPEKAWPLIVFLHGAGERGDDGMIQTEVGIGAAIRRHADRFPAVVILPQCPEKRFWDVAIPEIEAAMAETREAYNIDPARIYLTGLSMGGYATWTWGATKTETFAALMPICGGGNMLDLQGLVKDGFEYDFGTLEERVKKLATVPIYAFHGADDDVVPPARSQQMVGLVKEAGGKVKYREFEKTGHNSWDQAYGDEDAIQWLLKQKKKD